MTVYVDQPIFPFGRMMMCHMWADTVDELHKMAQQLALKREWFQEPPKASWHHYDVSKGVRARAIACGAVETDRYGASEFVARLTGDEKTLARIAEIRTRNMPAQGSLL